MQHNLDFPTPAAAETRVREPRRTPQPLTTRDADFGFIISCFLTVCNITATQNRLQYPITTILRADCVLYVLCA